MQTLELKVEQDHIESLAKIRNPMTAIEELIWNSLDADAKKVEVQLSFNNMSGLSKIQVSDNGSGIVFADCEKTFGHLGGSAKSRMEFTPAGRVPHGKLGKGRFRAFGLGRSVVWNSRYRENGDINQFEIKASKSSLTKFVVGNQTKAAKQETGVVVTIDQIDANYPSLIKSDQASEELSKRLALYLRKYPGIEIVYDGLRVDPTALERHAETYTVQIPDKDGKLVDAELTVIEWTTSTDRALYFCDESGFALEELPPGIKAPGFHFTAYLKSSVVPELVEDGAFAVQGMHPSVLAMIDAAKNTLRTHFRARESARATDLVKQWQADKVYPYEPSEQDPVKKIEREVFDVCAVKVHEYLPDFEKSEARSKRLTFRLIREALESNPDSLQKILHQVLDLPQDQQNDLAAILGRTHLAAIINATKTVVDRLDFIGSLDSLLFGDFKKTLLERKHLHRILAEELWIFGDQYQLGVDDESLANVLRKHINILERDDLTPENVSDVKDTEGKDRIVDLMLYRQIPQLQPETFEHLVIELKRPDCKLGKKELSQIEEYAFSIADDERFDKASTKWTFYLIGNELAPFADRKCREHGRKFGHIYSSDDGAINIHVKKWSSIITEAKWRYQFFKDKLELEVTTADGLEYLRKQHREHLPNS